MRRLPPIVRHVLLDRDGVLDREPSVGWVDDPSDWMWERGAQAGLVALADAGVRVSVVTNQSGIGRGEVPAARVEALHRWLALELDALGVDLVGIFVCPHAPDEGCGCRKPEPGLVLDAMAGSGVPSAQSVLIGDSERDLLAADAGGVEAVLVRTGKGRRTEVDIGDAVVVFDDLAVAVAAILHPGARSDGSTLR